MQNKFWLALGSILLLLPPWAAAIEAPPPSVKVEMGEAEPFCDSGVPAEWRKEQAIEGISIQASSICNPDNPYEIAAFVRGTNHISMDALMNTQLAADAVIKTNDMDGDGDPDHIIIKLEIMELNGRSPDFPGVVPTFDIAPGIQPGFWVFAPKSRDMSTKSFTSLEANPLLRVPSPPIRVEEGDVVWLVLENTHYFPHSIHLHGVDHPFMDHGGSGNDGVGQTSAMDVMPGESKTYAIKPRQAGTMYYHCHVQPHTHIPMGLQGLFIVEENRPNNWVQTFNVGAGQVRHPSVAVKEKYAQEYDLHYQSADKELHRLIQSANDPRIIAQAMNQEYDITDAKDDYFMLNGRSFPYTLRESLIVVEPNQKVKLRVLNGHTETLSLHTHGHKATSTHYDGVEHGPGGQITRDVHGLTTAQRVDLELNTEDDGLHSFGEGVWMFHDHVEKTFTTDGMGEGGSVSLIAYKNFIDENGKPETHGMDLAPYFSKAFWERKLPVWQDWDKWGSLAKPAPVSREVRPVKASVGNFAFPLRDLLVGLMLGASLYLLLANRTSIMRAIAQLTALAKRFKG